MKVHFFIITFFLILPRYDASEASSYNNRSDIVVLCDGWTSEERCILKVSANRTHPRFTPVAKNSTQVREVTLVGHAYVLTEDICNAFPNAEKLEFYVKIEDILPEAFVKCTKVKYIFLNDNNIRTLHRDTFRYNIQLDELEIQRNNLKELNTWLFASLVNLKLLNLHGNYLTEFPAELVRNNKKLITLNLSTNDLLDLDAAALVEYIPNLKSIIMNNNQFSCDRMQQILARNLYVINTSYLYVYRRRFYLQSTVDRFLCLPIQTWLNVYDQQKVLKNNNSVYKMSISDYKN